jgi:serine/threonine-protein kinase
MAPELAMGSPNLDGRTDLYALGCVAYWLITGSLVFEEKGVTAMLLAHLNKVPLPPSQRSEFPVPASLDRAIMMCLAKEPGERPARAEVLARVLESCDDVGSWTAEDAESWWNTNLPESPAAMEGDAKATHPEPDAAL